MVSIRIVVIALALNLADGDTRAAAQGIRSGLEAGPLQTPPRDRPLPVATGTATIKGRVVDIVTGLPLSRARVRLGGLPGPDQPTTDSNADGDFTFSGLPAGRYQVWGEKSGYVSGADAAIRRTLRRQPRSIQLGDGQTADGVRVELSRGAVITGRVLDEHGEPVEHAMVSVIRLPKSGRRTDLSRTHGGTQSDDIGEFRIARLERGSYLLRAHGRASNTSERQFAPTYYPAVDSVDEAQPIAIERGQVVEGVDVTLREVATTWVSGSVADAEGKPVTQGHINVVTFVAGSHSSWSNNGTNIRPDGSFRFRVAPGSYRLDASVPPASSASGSWVTRGSATIAVGSEPVTGVELQIGARAGASGRFVFEGTSPLPETRQAGLNFGARVGGMECRMGGPAEIRPDWTFTAQDVWGTCIARVWTGGRWTLKAVLHNGVNLRERPIEFKAGVQLRDVQIVFTDRRTELSFDVTDDRGLPTREFVAIAFPVERSRSDDSPGNVRTYVPPAQPLEPLRATGSPGAGSNAAIPGVSSTAPRPGMSALPPDEYFVVAVDDAAWDDLQDPAYLDELSKVAARITLGEGEARSVQLRRVPAPRVGEP